jgi:hypothetical protein
LAQAGRVHSTPRITASKIKARPTTEDHIRIDATRAHTYGELECQVMECFMQAEVAAIVVHDTLSDLVPKVTADQAMAVNWSPTSELFALSISGVSSLTGRRCNHDKGNQ